MQKKTLGFPLLAKKALGANSAALEQVLNIATV
jgi:hypothetical protein